jgi:asparagine synthase (glutamine-hydrolysing)
MNATIIHRGPDEEGIYEDDHVALAMQRLAIQDVCHGHQPARSESGDIVAMLNGEIYNVAAIRLMRSSEGTPWTVLATPSASRISMRSSGSPSSTTAGDVRDLAVGPRAQRLVLVRDRLGKKPLYWSEVGGELVFGSELKALLADPATPREADPVAISHYLTYQYVPAPWAAVKGVTEASSGPPCWYVTSQEPSAAVLVAGVRTRWIDGSGRPGVGRATPGGSCWTP